MGIYIGHVEVIRNNVSGDFYNFKPIVEIQGSQIVLLTQSDQEKLLPQSDKRDISFSFSWDNLKEREQMSSMFDDHSLVVFEFVASELSLNRKPNGEIKPTGYRVQAIDMISSKKIRRIDTVGMYYVVLKNEINSDFYNDAIVEILSPYVMMGDKVLVNIDGIWAGPFEVGYKASENMYFIKPQIKENKYTVYAYNCNEVEKLTLSDKFDDDGTVSWEVILPKKNCVTHQIDKITDKILLESFKDSVCSEIFEGSKINLTDIPALIENYDNSYLAGADLSDEIRRKRLNRLIEILTSEADIGDTLSTVTDSICDLLIKYQDHSKVEEWLQGLLEKKPNLFEQLRDTKSISTRIDQKRQELADLTEQRSAMEREIEETRQREKNTYQAAIDAKKQQLLEKDDEYAKLVARMDKLNKTYELGNNIAEMQEKQTELQREVDYLDLRKQHLVSDTSKLEGDFQQMIARIHDKTAEIAFDGYMTSKMLNAAVQWEAEEAKQHHEELITAVDSVSVTDKTPEELINYLCETINIVRPTYSRNTIVNIAICMTQGFLTVFSGFPGCGKTSICNIFADVLGLNKIANSINMECSIEADTQRYVSVSVERGWTSKRDLIGYYNPLSKVFDKSNSKVYNALHQLSTEKNSGLKKFPYIILLDEANLSPMEYYWSDFMNICDDLGANSRINLGENYIFGIPETLHFLATINNDLTTETLSPRLIDRAWIISLPQQYSGEVIDTTIPDDKIELITWKSLCDAFMPKEDEYSFTSTDVRKIYDSILQKMRDRKFSISPRLDRAIKKYCAVASKWFEMDETKTDKNIIALDYAIAQRVLPKISGSGEAFEVWLDELKNLCSNHSLNMSAKILKDMIERGNEQMKYYQFFY